MGKVGFSPKIWGKYIFFTFLTPKRHHLAPDRIFWYIPPKIPLTGLGCTPIEEPKKRKKRKKCHLG